jgi:hypothetical protein
METIVYRYNCLDVVRRDGRLFVHYDAGGHLILWREDEITEQEFQRLIAGPESMTKVMLEIQARLIAQGIDPYRSNWTPPEHRPDRPSKPAPEQGLT